MGTIPAARFAALLALLLVAAQASARPPFHGGFLEGRGDPGRHFLDEHADRLGIDEETRAKIRAELDASHTRSVPLRDQLHEGYGELRDLLMQDSPDREAVMKRAEELGELKTRLRKLRLGTLLDVRALLTPEQRAELTAIHEERKSRRMGRFLDACDGDLGALCPEAEDPREVFRCLKEQRESLSEQCRDSLRRRPFGRRHGRTHRGGYGRGGECDDGPPES